MQLLDNIKKSTELQFPPEATNLSPDCMDLCRKLLRCNPGISWCLHIVYRQYRVHHRDNHSIKLINTYCSISDRMNIRFPSNIRNKQTWFIMLPFAIEFDPPKNIFLTAYCLLYSINNLIKTDLVVYNRRAFGTVISIHCFYVPWDLF